MIKVGIIGSGFGLYGLFPAFNSTRGAKVVAICGKKTERLINYCQKVGLKKIYTDWQKMLDEEKLDALAIAVTPNSQYEIAKVAIKKGLHIFAEKPLARSLAQAKELLNLAEKKKIKHAIDFEFPDIEEWKKVKSLIIDEEKFGKLKQICVSWDFLSHDIKHQISSWKTNIAEGGGALAYYFSHSLYYLEHFAGEILNFKSQFYYSKESPNGGEIGVDLLINFKNGVCGNAHFCCNCKGLDRHQLIFICEKGTIILENRNSITKNFTVKIYTGGKIKKLYLAKDKIEKNEDERVVIVKKIAKRFIGSIVYDKNVTPSFKEGVRVQELIEKIRNSNV